MNNSINEIDILSKIRKVEFFKEFKDNDEVIEKIAGLCSQHHYVKGNYIIKEGDFGDELFIVIGGTIEIAKKTMQDEEYTVIALDANNRGGITVGEIALIDNDRRSASVIACTDCDCLTVNRQDFLKFGDDNPRVGLGITRAIASQLARSLRKSNTDVITLFSALVEEIAEIE